MRYSVGKKAALIGCFLAICASAEPPATDFLTLELSGAGAGNMKESGHVIDRQSETMTAFTYTRRHAIRQGPFYVSGGFRGERFGFDNTQDFPVRELQDYGAELSLGYFIGDVRAAYLTLRPGFYFETHPTLAAWDVPVEMATGIPITSVLNGIVGVSYGRFYHHPVPIAGLSWNVGNVWRVDALYPNPALVYTISPQLDVSLAGELIGNGFRTDAVPGRSIVEYHVYRLGANLGWLLHPHFKMTLGAGAEYERVFDFWRAGRSFKATGLPYLHIGIEYSPHRSR